MRSVVNGTVQKVDGDNIVVTTTNGTITVVTTHETAFSQLARGSTDDLQEGMQVYVTAEKSGDALNAQTIRVLGARQTRERTNNSTPTPGA